MKRQLTRLLTALLAVILLLPVTAQAAPAWDGWTAELEAAYQTVSGLVADSVSESRDYLSAARQETNAKAVYALWASGADVPEGFYNEYLQALADWLALAEQRGRYAYIPGALRTVAAMGLDVTDLAGHDLLEPLRRPEMVEADEDRLDMLLDLDAAGDAGKTDEFSALREQLLTEALARQQSSGEFRYTSKWPAELKQKGVAAEPDRFDYILLTAKSAQALAPYQSRPEVRAAIEKAVSYLSMQQLDSGGFLRYGEEDVEEDAAVLEMLAALDISPDDGRFVKNGHTVLDGMMDWYQESYFDGAPAPGQGFYRHDILWGYRGSGDAWYASSSSLMSDPDAPDDRGKAVERRTYINEAGLIGLCSVRPAVAVAGTPSASTPEKGNRQDNAIDYSELLQAQSADYAQKLAEGYYGDGNSTIVSEGALSHLAKEILSMSEAGGGKLPEEQRAQLESLVEMLSGASGEYLMGRKANTYSPVLVQAMKALDTTYRAEKVDAVVSKLIRDILQKAGAVSEYDIVQNQIGATASDLQQQIRQAKLELSKKHIEQGRWEGLMLDSLDGKCPFTPEQVKSRLDSVKDAMTALTASIESLETRLADSDRLTQELKEQHQQLLSWAEMFDNATPAERKLIASHLIRAVTLTRGYGIQIDFNISEAQYLNGMEL